MNRSFWRSVACCGLVLLTALVCQNISAQQTLGSINGTVVDPSGAAVPGAAITVSNRAIGVTRTTTSQSNGFYQIFNLPIGVYTVKVGHDGFDTTAIAGIVVQEARASTVNASLKLGKASESIEVTANPLLNATDATNGYTLDSEQISLTPLATGSFTQLAVLTPGVNAELLSGIGTNAGLGNQPIWANGQRDTSNTFQVDGVDVTNLFNGKSSSADASLRINFNIGSGASGGVGQTGGAAITSTSVYGSNGNGLPSPPPEFLQEIRVNASMYDAQQGATSGAQVDANISSGTNMWHGQTYSVIATNDLNAAPYFFKQSYLLSQAGVGTPFPKILENPALHRVTVGATAGGPLVKNKLFFFAGYQHVHTTDQTQGYSQIGVPDGLTNDRSAAGLLTALNSWYDPTGATLHYSSYNIDPTAAAILNTKLPNGQFMIPSAQGALVGGTDVTLLSPTLFTADQATASLDYDLTKSDRLSLKYFYQHDPAFNPYTISSVGGFPENEDSGSHVAALDNTISLGPKINWEQRLGFVRMKVYSNFRQDLAGLSSPTLGIPFPNATGVPGMSLGKFNCKAGPNCQNTKSITAGPYSEFVDAGYFQNRLNPSTNVIFAMGKHTIVVGGGDSYTQLNIRNLRTGLGQLSTKDFSTFLAGNLKSASILDSIGADGHNYANRYYRSNEISSYAQDKYQIMSNLSLTAGVRYDYHGGFTEKYGNLFNFEPSSYDVTGDTNVGFTVNNGGFVVANNNKYYPTPGVSGSTLTGRQWGISPRLGFAWAPEKYRGNFIVSGGAGMYYDRGELFSYMSQPAGGGIGGPFGVTMAPPLAAAYSASNTSFEKPMGSTVITPPNPNPQFFTNTLQNVLTSDVANCTALGNEYDAGGGDGCNTPFYFGAYARDNKLPYTINYTLKVQWQPRPDTAVSIGYTGNRGRHSVIPLPFNEPQIATPSSPAMVKGKEPHPDGETYSYGYQVLNQNAPVPCYSGSGAPTCYQPISTEKWDSYEGGNIDFRVPYPGYDPSAALFKAVGISAYDSLEVHVEKKLSHSFELGASYTYGHALDEQSDIGLFFTGDNPDKLRDSWASSDFDRTHVFSGSFMVAVPNATKSRHSLLAYAANDWKLTGLAILQSGEPYSLYEFYGAVGSVYFGNYPNLANPVLPIKNPGNPKSALTGQKGGYRDSSGNYYPAIDPSQITIPTIDPQNNTLGVPPCTGSEPCDYFETNFVPGQRNIFRQAAQRRLDMSVRKAFRFTERVGMEVQFNAFNITNTTSYDIPQDQTDIGQAYVGDEANYGQVQATQGQEQAAFSQLYVLPSSTKNGNGQVTSSNLFGSVTNTIGSARVIDAGVHVTF
ncbi:MAG TPA: carboxypeptidase regulatory-like domain-containing protein [Terracidiphilus sp.]|jgi:hypothetical protein|nr:carboxypeptidase regulatory-like domain-containing protein [Terracidiphilus sp.]